MCSFQSQGVLTACRMLQISIAQHQMKAKIHRFSTVYILGGGRCGQFKVFVQELGLKTSISAERNLDFLTLAGSGTPNFEVLPLSTLPLKSLVNFGQIELWACPVASKLSQCRPFTFFHRAAHKKLKKRVLFASCPITPMQNFLRGIQGMPSES